MKKKVLATLLVGAMAASLLAGCGTTVETTGSSDTTTAPEKTQTTETAEAGEAGGSDVSADITLWTYPIGEWGNAETVDSLIQDFNKEYPGINVTVEYLDYTNGDDQVNTAIEGGQAPDLMNLIFMFLIPVRSRSLVSISASQDFPSVLAVRYLSTSSL